MRRITFTPDRRLAYKCQHRRWSNGTKGKCTSDCNMEVEAVDRLLVGAEGRDERHEDTVDRLLVGVEGHEEGHEDTPE